eukprot:scaffold150453_cov20-Tisochrysis_lutea.AAC.1
MKRKSTSAQRKSSTIALPACAAPTNEAAVFAPHRACFGGKCGEGGKGQAGVQSSSSCQKSWHTTMYGIGTNEEDAGHSICSATLCGKSPASSACTSHSLLLADSMHTMLWRVKAGILSVGSRKHTET